MNVAKKVLAVVLCLALCAMMPVSLAISAEDTTEQAAARTDLVTAWQALSKQVTEEVAMVPASWTDANGKTVARKEATDKAKWGSYWYENLCVSTDGKAPGWGTQFPFQLLNSPVDLTKYTKLIFNLHATNNGTDVQVKVNTQVNHGNSVYVDYSDERKVATTVAAATHIKFLIESATNGVTHVSFGSVLGTYTEKPALPENYETVELSKLVFAAKKVDLTGYDAVQVSAFESALLAALPLVEDELLVLAREELVNTWSNLSKEVTDVIAIPPESEYRHETADDTVLDGLAGANLGTHYAEYVPVGNDQIMQLPIKPVDLTQYTTLTFYMRGYDADKNPIRFKLWLQTATGGSNVDDFNGGNQWGSDAWRNVPFSATQKGSVTRIKFNFQNPDSASISGKPAYVSYGCVLGTRTQTAELPEGYESLSLAQLIKAAEAVDLTGYNAEAAAAFTAAIQAAKEQTEEPLKLAVMNAWTGLSKLVYDVVATPNGGVDVPKTVEGLTDASVLGTTYLDKQEYDGTGHKGLYYTFTDKWSLTKYDNYTVWFCAYKDGAESRMNLEWTTDYTGKTIARLTGTGWTKFTVTKQTMNSVTHNGPFAFRQDWGDGTPNTALSIGSVLGSYTASEVLPKDALSMSAAELLNAAKALDMTAYTEGTEAFTAAVEALDVALNTTVSVDTVAGGTLAVDNVMAQAGETVTVTVTPDEGYQLKAGSLLVLDENSNVVAIPERVGFREDQSNNTFAFPMTDGKVTVTAVFVSPAEATVPNMALVGRSINVEKQGLRSIYRMYITEEDGTYYVTLNGVKTAVDGFGVLLCTKKTYDSLQLAGNDMNLDAVGTKGLIKTEFSSNNMRYDVCAEYLDVSVQVVGLNTTVRQETPIYTRAYIEAGGQVFYTDAAAQSYAHYVA